ncbi:MAG: two-component system, chemotaxis family, CheB/CheR fusion protein [Chloroflexia bacterium]|jgi:two-component system CheB/CheR fusion protein|nr:two-component system, chemotaxis family, CheB/CheR fusion protein [Chloroflexia bacterium]
MPRKSRSKEANGAPQETQQEAQHDTEQESEQGSQQQNEAEQRVPGQIDPQHRLVVIGSSAGGIQALTVLVSTLPRNFPAPIVLAQHLDPNRPSNLSAILERRSSLPIVTVTGSTRLEGGTIYVVPANRHVGVADGHVEILSDQVGRPKPSIDLLLSTAAQSYGDRLVAVVLTGVGNDGAAGAVDVKNAGGYVVIQNPSTARYPSMPLALPPTAVDHVADIENMATTLVDLLRGTALPVLEGQPGDALEQILGVVNRQVSLDFRQYKQTTILRRIYRRMVVTRNATLAEYKDYLLRHVEEVVELAKAFLIKVTEFFRDPEAFEFLKTSVLPEIIKRGRTKGRTLRFWSAGCATGEEPYSLALLLADILGHELADWNIKIFATDADEDAINFARRGLYPENLLNNLPEGYKTQYFKKVDQGYQISKLLRQMVIFGQQDLSRGVPFPRVDLVVCRNLLIYFKPDVQHQVLEMFTFSLHQTQGFLFLGHAETVRPSQTSYEQVEKRWKIYRCVRTRPTSTTERSERASGAGNGRSRRDVIEQLRPMLASVAPRPELSAPEPDLLNLRQFNEIVLRHLPVGVVVIDRTYRILSINSTARGLLALREMGTEQDFLHSVRGLPYSQVRAAIDDAFRDRTTTVIQELELDPGAGGNGLYVTITMVPVEGEQGAQGLQVISVQDVTEHVETRRSLEAVQAEQKEVLSEIQITNRRLSEMNKDLQDANEELQATNEELMLAQEELQATNEEFEATNEELQATNEELETNNEELQATNEELETTNEELISRTSELQDLTQVLATERKRLLEMVEQAPFYILILRGPNLAIDAFNPNYARLFGGREVAGMPFEEMLNHLAPETKSLIDLVRASYLYNESRIVVNIPTLVADDDGSTSIRNFTYTAIPMHDGGNKVDGVALYGNDLSAYILDTGDISGVPPDDASD